MTEESHGAAIRAIRVVPDVAGVDRQFVYSVPLDIDVSVGMVVRVQLAGRKVRAWIVEDGVDPPDGVDLKPIEGVVSIALDPAIVTLARYASWRYAGRLRRFLLAGTPTRRVLPPDRSAVAREDLSDLVEVQRTNEQPGDSVKGPLGPVEAATRSLIDSGGGVLELPPNASRLSVVEAFIEAIADGSAGARGLLVLVPEHRDAEVLAHSLDQRGYHCALLPDGFASAYAGAPVVVGTRNAAFGPMRDLGGVLVIDIHAEAYVDERAPTWNAVVVARERARLAGVPWVMTSPCPPLVATHPWGCAELPLEFRRAHWPALDVIDRREDDPRSGLYATTLAEVIREALDRDERPVACVLHRTGRLRLLACGHCGELVRCDDCGGAMQQTERPAPGTATLLSCVSCGVSRPVICASCGSVVLRSLRIGAARAAEELSALVREPTRLVTGERHGNGTAELDDVPGRLLVGTEAVLHRLRVASLVVFLDFDQHLLAPRFNAAEQAVALLARAGRLVGSRRAQIGRTFTRRVLVQTRLPNHEVLESARSGILASLRDREAEFRRDAALPPFSALALISGEGADEAARRLAGEHGLLLTELGPAIGARGQSSETRLLVRAANAKILSDALAPVIAEGVRARIAVDPINI